MSKFDRLFSLVALFIEEVLPSLREAAELSRLLSGRGMLEAYDALQIQPSERLESLTADILKELGPKSPLRDARDILEILGEELVSIPRSDDRIRNWFNASVTRLRHPLRQFRFRVPVSAPSGIGINMDLGTVDALQIRNCSPDSEPRLMELLGCIEAPAEYRVLDRVDRHIKSIAGAFIASGMARHYYARISNIPLVSIEGSVEQLHLDAAIGALGRVENRHIIL